MTTFPGSLRLSKSGIVLINPETSAVPLEINIEELVLHGFAPGDRHRIVEVMEQELIWLLVD